MKTWLHVLWRLLALVVLIAVTVYLTINLQASTPVAQCGIVRIDMYVRNSVFTTLLWMFVIFSEMAYFKDSQQFYKYTINKILITIALVMVGVFLSSVYIPALYILFYGWIF